MLFRGGMVLGDLVLEHFHILNLLCFLFHQLHVLPTLLTNLVVLSLNMLPEAAKPVIPEFDGQEEILC